MTNLSRVFIYSRCIQNVSKKLLLLARKFHSAIERELKYRFEKRNQCLKHKTAKNTHRVNAFNLFKSRDGRRNS